MHERNPHTDAAEPLHPGVSRREFLRRAGHGAALAAGLAAGHRAAHAQEKAARVIVARDPGCVVEGEVDAERVAALLDRAMAALAGAEAPAAWSAMFAATDTVGLKTTVMMNPVHADLLVAIHGALTGSAGVADECVRAFDRGRGGVGLAELPGYPRRLDYGDDHIATWVHECTALINVPSLKRHWISGVAMSVKNWCGAVNGINPLDGPDAVFKIHGDGCAGMGQLNALEPIKSRCRLVVIDALTPCHGPGPQVNPADLFDHGALILSTDPVAADVVGASVLQAKIDEVAGRPTPITPEPTYLKVADERYGLGCSDLTRIEVVEV
jgi:hypothetical protein